VFTEQTLCKISSCSAGTFHYLSLFGLLQQNNTNDRHLFLIVPEPRSQKSKASADSVSEEGPNSFIDGTSSHGRRVRKFFVATFIRSLILFMKARLSRLKSPL
jgi:hypothetical protein